MQSMVGHLRTVDDAVAELAKALCHALGGGTIRPLAEALAAEERGRAFRRLTDILVSFGSRGRDAVEQLKQSAEPGRAAHRDPPAREFGGNDALTGAGAAGRRQGAERPARSHPRDREHRHGRGLRGAGEGARGAATSSRARPSRRRSCRSATSAPSRSSATSVRTREYRRTLRTVYETAIEALGALGGTRRRWKR